MWYDPIGVEYVFVYILGYNYFTPTGLHIGIHFIDDLINPEWIWWL